MVDIRGYFMIERNILQMIFSFITVISRVHYNISTPLSFCLVTIVLPFLKRKRTGFSSFEMSGLTLLKCPIRNLERISMNWCRYIFLPFVRLKFDLVFAQDSFLSLFLSVIALQVRQKFSTKGLNVFLQFLMVNCRCRCEL